MHVIATAGHVDHGKSTLVRALTGTDPDRLTEERRRGLSIELGYCWTTLPGLGDVAFVDVPGHERFIATMLAGVGPVPAVLFVVAADDPWMPQAAEHLAALDALGTSRAVVAVTRCDLVPGDEAAAAVVRARTALGATSLAGSPVLMVSGSTGAGLDELRQAVAALVAALPEPARDADVRLWVDRCFHVRGAGTVVTGTLPAGTVTVGGTLTTGEGAALRVRGVQSLGRPVASAHGVARVALNLSGPDVDRLTRDSVLVSPGRWLFTDTVDVRLVGHCGDRGSDGGGGLGEDRGRGGHGADRGSGRAHGGDRCSGGAHGGDRGQLAEDGIARGTALDDGRHAVPGDIPQRPVLHVGATHVAAHHRPLGRDAARLRLERPLPLRVGDRVIVRDPGTRRIWGAVVLDPAPAPLRRRGDAAKRAAQLGRHPGIPDVAWEVAVRGASRRAFLAEIGVPVPPSDTGGEPSARLVSAGDWVLGVEQAAQLRHRLRTLVERHESRAPLSPGLPLSAASATLGLPSAELIHALATAPLQVVDGRLTTQRRDALPAAVELSVAQLVAELGGQPFAAPTADRLRELRLDAKALAAAARAGRLLRLEDGVVLLPGAESTAAEALRGIPQPFTTSEARQRLGTSRRVAIPLLAHLDRLGVTRRHHDDRRSVR